MLQGGRGDILQKLSSCNATKTTLHPLLSRRATRILCVRTLACKHGFAGSRHGRVRHGGGFHLLLHIHIAAVGPLYSAVVYDLPLVKAHACEVSTGFQVPASLSLRTLSRACIGSRSLCPHACSHALACSLFLQWAKACEPARRDDRRRPRRGVWRAARGHACTFWGTKSSFMMGSSALR